MTLGEVVAVLESHLNKQLRLSEERMSEIRDLLNGVAIGFNQNNPEGVWKADLDEQEKAQELPLDTSAILPK